MLGFVIGGSLFVPDMDFWNQNINVQRYGIALSFVSDIRHMKLDEPVGYSSKDSGKDDFRICGNGRWRRREPSECDRDYE